MSKTEYDELEQILNTHIPYHTANGDTMCACGSNVVYPYEITPSNKFGLLGHFYHIANIILSSLDSLSYRKHGLRKTVRVLQGHTLYWVYNSQSFICECGEIEPFLDIENDALTHLHNKHITDKLLTV